MDDVISVTPPSWSDGDRIDFDFPVFGTGFETGWGCHERRRRDAEDLSVVYMYFFFCNTCKFAYCVVHVFGDFERLVLGCIGAYFYNLKAVDECYGFYVRVFCTTRTSTKQNNCFFAIFIFVYKNIFTLNFAFLIF